MDIAEFYLRDLSRLCEPLSYPLTPAGVKKVRESYNEAKFNASYAPPLIYASYLGLEPLVKAFIECAKQTNMNLHTGEMGKVQEFLWLTHNTGETAFDVAIEKNNVEIAKLLLKNASLECLISERNYLGQLPISLLSDSKYDGFIFDILEKAIEREVYPPTSSIVIPIDDHRQQGSLVYNEATMSPLSYPVSHKNGDGISTELCMRSLDSGLIEVTPNKNTILHLVSEWGNVNYVKEILKNHSSLLYRRNSEGETAAYVAAREGHVDILAIMINYFKNKKDDIELLVTRDMDKDTALHIAIRNHHVGVVFWLMFEIPQLINCVNDYSMIPHFLAAERGFEHILENVISKCNLLDVTTRNGKTTLHAAAVFGSEACISIVMRYSKDLLYKQDERGWTPLFYAIYHNNSSATGTLLDADCSIGYKMLNEDDISTSPIHFAVSLGDCETMKVLISRCPGCLDITCGNGKNILHFAIENKKYEVIKFMFSCELFTRLINKRDGDGDTPIHSFMKSDIEMMEAIIDSRVNIYALNNENRTPLDVASSDEKRKRLLKGIGNVRGIGNQTRVLLPVISLSSRFDEYLRQTEEKKRKEEELKLREPPKKGFEPYFKIVDNLVLVATLIATATFAGIYSVPGGFDSNEGSNQGNPILLRKAAYKAFIVTNTIAFSCSCSILIGYTWMLLYRCGSNKTRDYKIRASIIERLEIMYSLTGVALISMSIAFMTGIYVVLTPSISLAISSCLMSSCILVMGSVFPKVVARLIEYVGDELQDLIYFVIEKMK
ncbi:protein ACCELERATED CELL DEATH 6-like [Rutidosis leptorrhynchoides]|uniref:protein ACCELERATED CELL DEATH 6-like n=1 Tax=Rutidosis leptorrhynchoides TaxID=125765 RepID=UPI003A9A0872